MKQPSFLSPGDTILIVATARKISAEEVEPAVSILKQWGLKPVKAPHLHKVKNQFAGSDEQRAADLQWALNHPTAKAILVARGGYGTVRIIDQVSFSSFIKKPKWLIGYSDITVLHNRLNKLGVQSIHATMPINFNQNKQALNTLRDVLFGKSIHYSIKPHRLNRIGNTQGILTGGNLSVIYSLSGSIDEIDTKNKVLFLEDLDEYIYHIDRMMMQLKRSGKLKELKGLIIGGFTDMKDNKIPFGKNAEEIIFDAVKEYNYPVCFNFPAGHIKKNLAFYLGKKISLKVTKNHVEFSYL